MRLMTTFALLAFSQAAVASPVFLGNDFVSNAGNAMPAEELNITAYYDGDGAADMGVQVDCNGQLEWLVMTPLVPGVVETFAYDLAGCTLTGRAGVRNAVANGVVDGVAYGLLWKDANGDMHVHKSSGERAGQHVLGIWPTGFASDGAWIVANAPGITNGAEVAKTMLPGTVLMDNGVHPFPAN